MKSVLKKMLIGSFTLFILLILLCIGILSFTPNPLFSVIKAFPIEADLTKPRDYLAIEKKSQVVKDIQYSTIYPNSSLDMYSPEGTAEKMPIMLFIHGGGFFKGEKEMTKYFGPTISSNHYAFISINYDLIPNATIFDQVKQVNEALRFIVKNADKYSLDINRINLSGSSAGGFLALQLVSAYYNKEYAERLDLQTIDNVEINSLLLYSAVYDLSEFQTFEGNIVTEYFLSKMGWGLTGIKEWQNDRDLGKILNLNEYVKKYFPPIFITDGNTNTFTKQANDYASKLKTLDVPVQTLFFDSKEKVGHGYQLQMNSHASEKATKESIEFLTIWN
jgi:acetyl esterase